MVESAQQRNRWRFSVGFLLTLTTTAAFGVFGWTLYPRSQEVFAAYRMWVERLVLPAPALTFSAVVIAGGWRHRTSLWYGLLAGFAPGCFLLREARWDLFPQSLALVTTPPLLASALAGCLAMWFGGRVVVSTTLAMLTSTQIGFWTYAVLDLFWTYVIWNGFL